jgi:hypothetical protein
MNLREEFEHEVSHGINNGESEILGNQKAIEYINWLECKILALSQSAVSESVCSTCRFHKSEKYHDKMWCRDCTKKNHYEQTGH